ncbi:hypothetical protein [Deinococcus marmoris]|uniref:Uncharacterized protein n=1 Tax=Deinococcus marmoris TaxID=249408 RepID=A0A1U7P301_9DEIO|nr:hypothetical protein [Deinococcus marmoris]OLV19557.1 hypothetical protein BOO71_0002410 [Deinococcus marmoris]
MSAVVVITGPAAHELALRASHYLPGVRVQDRSSYAHGPDHEALSILAWGASSGPDSESVIITAPQVDLPPVRLPPTAQWIYATPRTSPAVALLAMTRAQEAIR